MAALITYGTGGGTFADDPPPSLFPRLRDYSGDDAYRYIMERLASMIGYERNDYGQLEKVRDSQLFITDILRGPDYTRDTVGLSLHARVLDPQTNTHRATEDQDHDLLHAVRAHKIKVRCIPGRSDSVKFKRGVVPDPRPKMLAQARGHGIGLDSTGQGDVSFQKFVPKMVDQWVDYQATEAELPLLDAWVCLRQGGKFCRVADSSRLQERYWLFEEVPPEPEVKRAPIKRGN